MDGWDGEESKFNCLLVLVCEGTSGSMVGFYLSGWIPEVSKGACQDISTTNPTGWGGSPAIETLRTIVSAAIWCAVLWNLDGMASMIDTSAVKQHKNAKGKSMPHTKLEFLSYYLKLFILNWLYKTACHMPGVIDRLNLLSFVSWGVSYFCRCTC